MIEPEAILFRDQLGHGGFAAVAPAAQEVDVLELFPEDIIRYLHNGSPSLFYTGRGIQGGNQRDRPSVVSPHPRMDMRDAPLFLKLTLLYSICKRLSRETGLGHTGSPLSAMRAGVRHMVSGISS